MNKKEFDELTRKFRIDILEMVYNAGSGHIGGSFSVIDLLTYIYFVDSNISESIKKYKDVFLEKSFNELSKERESIDKVILSKGHASPAMYSILIKLGAIDPKEFYSFRRVDGILEGHVSKHASNFIDYSGGSLGQGLSFGVGVAKYFKDKNIDRNIYVILGDGELDEGQNYEALALANKLKLDNLCVIIDKNKVQLDGTTDEIMPLLDLNKKIESFGLNVVSGDGHDFNDLKRVMDMYHKNKGKGKPFCIILDTVKGKGVSFMENTYKWHGKAPNEKEYEDAIRELGGLN